MPGTKHERWLERNDADGSAHRVPVGTIVGAQPGKRITIFAGQHGTEYDGIEAAQRVYRTIDPADVRGTIDIALVLNLSSFQSWTQFAPTPAPVLEIMRTLATGSDGLINCHGGEFSEGMCPYVICRQIGREETDRRAVAMADAFGLPYISISQYRGEPPVDPSGTRPPWWLWPRKSMADELQIPEITPEVGEQGSRDPRGVMFEGIVNVLRRLGVLAGEPVAPATPPRVIGERHWLTASEEGTFTPAVRVCQDVSPGDLLGTVRDYFGNLVQEVRSPAAAKVMNLNAAMPVRKDGFLLWLGEV